MQKQPNMANPVHLLAFGLGSGLSPYAPGTAGSLVGLLAFIPCLYWSVASQLVVIGVAALVGVVICHIAARDLGVHDHPGIVWDEFVGMWITLLALPQIQGTHTILWLGVGFVLFRLFDIVKPWPIKWLDQKVVGGLGIMLDDIVAGILAALSLQGIAYVWLAGT